MTTERVPDRVRVEVAGLFPGYFALVMATGIVSLASHYLLADGIAYVLFGLNVAFYVVLLVLSLERLILFRDRMWQDLASHRRGPAFLTTVAGTCVLGTQFVALTPWVGIGSALWILGIGLWLVLMYTLLTRIVVAQTKPTLESGLTGAWLLLTVSTQSIAVLAATLAPHAGANGLAVLAIATFAFLLGCMLYLPVISLIFDRWTFVHMTPEDLGPPYWITMGATAISTLAAVRLITNGSDWALLQQIDPFVRGLALMFWVFGSWWIPLLVILGGWRHVGRRVPLTYDPQFWSLVFPIGMYTVATFVLAQVTDLGVLYAIAHVVVYFALGAWLVVLAGMVRHVGGVLVPSTQGMHTA
jgi:tellurite resistance protein TehA-like permease